VAAAGGHPASKVAYRVAWEEEVEVPAGKFKAVRVEAVRAAGGREVRYTTWYAPGVGVVKHVLGDEADRDNSQVQALKAFTSGKK
jgi:hypothetical protein